MINKKVLDQNKLLVKCENLILGDEINILMVTDVHRDSIYHNKYLLKKHFDEAKEIGAFIFSNGDWFDVMGCHKDPRSKMQDVRPEFIKNDESYLDLVIEESYEFLKPYRNNLLGFGYGNHETAILKHRDTDPLKRLVDLLNAGYDDDIFVSRYFGFLFFHLSQKSGCRVRQFNIMHHHGYGGSAKRSKGVLNVDLDSQQFPFVDVHFSGHTHQKWMVPSISHQLNRMYEIKEKKQFHVKGGSYKKTLGKNMGWEVEKGFNPTPQGGWWINAKYRDKGIELTIKEAN